MSCKKAVFLFKEVFFSLLILGFFSFSINYTLAAQGTPQIFSYQGRLFDSAGSLQGSSSGTTFYFKFSIWDNATVGSGSRLWPITPPSSASVTVTSGVFNVNIGDTDNGYPDQLDYDFNTNETIYLQIEVSSDNDAFETLSPRLQIASANFSQLSAAVSGTTTPSMFGTTSPASGGTQVTIEATSTNSTALAIRGISGQVADLFQIQEAADGINRFIVDSNFRLGLGTTTIGGDLGLFGLAIEGAARVGSFLTASYFTATSTTATSTFRGGVELAREAGSVGIGTSTPTGTFAVSGNSYFSGGITLGTSNTDATTTPGHLRATLLHSDTQIVLAGLLSCDTLDTDANGVVKCGTDATGGASDSGWTDTGSIVRLTTSTDLVELNDLYVLGSDINIGDGKTATTTLTGAGGNLGIGTTTPGAGLALGSGTTTILGYDVYTWGPIKVPYVIATSTTATTTFAGGLAIETTGFVYDFSSGNVGIGLADPQYALEIQNNSAANLSLTGTTPTLVFNETDVAGDDYSFEVITGTFRFTEIGVATRWTIDGSGNVAIGNDNSGVSRLEVAGGDLTISAGDLFVLGSNINLGNGLVATTTLSGEYGKLGLGTTSPYGQFSIEAVQGVVGSSTPIFVVGDQGTSSPFIYVSGIDGSVGIGTSTPTGTFAVSGNSYFSGGLTLGTTNTDATTTPGHLRATFLHSDTQLVLGGLLNCNTLDTDGAGVVKCGTDETGGASSSDLQDTYNTSASDAQITTTDNKDLVFFSDNTATDANIQIALHPSGGGQFQVLNTDGNSTTTVLSINRDGSLGIGTTTPGGALSIGSGTTTIFAGPVHALDNLKVATLIATNTLDVRGAGTSTFSGGVDVTTTGGLSSAQGLTITGGDILSSGVLKVTNTTSTSTFDGGLAIESTGFVYDFSSGNVGIGLSAPEAALDIQNNSANNLQLTGTTPTLRLIETDVAGDDFSFEVVTGTFRFTEIGVATRWTVDGSGNVAIGNDNSGVSRLEVAGGDLTISAGDLFVLGSDINIGNGLVATTTLHGEYGKLGFGTTSPWGQFSVESVAGVVGSNTPIFVIGDQGSSSPFIYVSGNNGNVGIGTANPGGILSVANFSGAEQFRVANTASAVNYVQVTGGTTGSQVIISAEGSDTNVGAYIVTKGSGAIQFNGNGSTNGANGILRLNPATSATSNGIIIHNASSGNTPYIAASDLGGTGDANISLELRPVGTGGIGISSTSPGTKLDVAGFGVVKGNWNVEATSTVSSLIATSTLEVRGALTGGIPDFGVAEGRVGIGSSTPYGQFSVEATAGTVNANTPIFVVGDSGTSSPFIYVSGNNGNVGIGTANPVTRLTIRPDSNTNQLHLMQDNVGPESSNPTLDDGWTFHADSGGGALRIKRRASSADSERLAITAGGDVGIGTTTPATTLSVVGSALITGTTTVQEIKFMESDIGSSTPNRNTLYANNIVKAWINFDGTGTIFVRDSFNVSSIVDGGTGDYDVNWDLDFANSSYATVCSAGTRASAGNFFVTINGQTILGGETYLDPTQVDITVSNDAGTETDVESIRCIAVGAQ